MQILTERPSIQRFIANFGRSLLTDAAGWDGWCLLVISGDPALDEMQAGKVAVLTRSTLPKGDGAVLWLERGPVLALFETQRAFAPKVFETTLRKNTGIALPPLSVAAFSVAEEREAVLKFLQNHAQPPVASDPAPATLQALKALVPNIGDLLKAWMVNSKARKERRSPSVMVVDDDPLTRHIVGRALKEDYQLVSAQSASEAIEKHLLFTPDIVFLDIDLPDHDGFTILYWLRQVDAQCQIVMFSSNSYLENRLKAYAGGANGFVPKPFSRNAFDSYLAIWQPGLAGGAAL